MTIFLDELADRFHELHADLVNTIKNLSVEAFDWVPGKEMNSITVLIVHLTGSERFLLGLALGEPPTRDREAEFKAHNLTQEDLVARVKEAEEFVKTVLNRINPDDLEKSQLHPRTGKRVSVAWCLLHALDHASIHTGHIQMTRQLWEQRKA